MSLTWEGSPVKVTVEAELCDFPDPPETPAEREYRLWREYVDDYDFSPEELHDIEPREDESADTVN